MLRPNVESTVFRSVDLPLEDNSFVELPSEIYNMQMPSGMPPHVLKLKPGCVVILLRNINVGQGLCNGSRLIVKEINEKLVLYLGKLSEKDRRLFIDATIKGYRYKELTERYQMTEGNISVKIFRLRMRLRKMFDLED